jgi:hypothetical protein
LRRLALRGRPDLWFWDCSNAILNDIQHHQFDTIKKRISTAGLPCKSLNISQGKYTANIATFERLQVGTVRFFAYGVQAEIAELLNERLCNIGALRKDGFGAVREIRVERVEMPYCCWDAESLLLLRDVPAGENPFRYLRDPDIIVRWGRFRPPYNPEQGVDQSPLIAEGSRVNLESLVEILA